MPKAISRLNPPTVMKNLVSLLVLSLGSLVSLTDVAPSHSSLLPRRVTLKLKPRHTKTKRVGDPRREAATIHRGSLGQRRIVPPLLAVGVQDCRIDGLSCNR